MHPLEKVGTEDCDMQYDVAVITINYNSSRFTIDCVTSILEKTDPKLNLHIVIVDNNSTPEEYKKLDSLRNLEKVSIVRSKINYGYAAGNMYGVQFARAKYYFFLNNDCVLLNDCTSILFDFCEKNQGAALCSPQLYTDKYQPAPCFDYFPSLLSKFLGTGIFRITRGKDFHPIKKIPTTPIKVDVLSGSQLFVRAGTFNKVGGFDTTFFLYCEEEDIAFRLKKLGYNSYLVPAAHNWHFGGGSTERSLATHKEFLISYLYFYRKHYGFLKTQFLKLYMLLRYTRKTITDISNIHIVILILAGAHLRNSLRHKQAINEPVTNATISKKPKASVIIAIYKDIEALNCILLGLTRQTEKDFEVIVTEDCEDPAVADYIKHRAPRSLALKHLTQEDIGFRKTRAVNRAIVKADADYLIFLDGDCIPHSRFVEMHLLHAKPKRVCTARRVHLGPRESQKARQHPDTIVELENRLTVFRRIISLHRDHIRNYELAFPSKLLHNLAKSRHLSIVGCNFSCFKADMEAINGYNEELPGIGGEDCDLEWRFNGLDIFTKNIKFQATTYHLHHESRRMDSDINVEISRRNRENGEYICKYGLSNHVRSALAKEA
jgi:GT2 family glycosyltransferase